MAHRLAPGVASELDAIWLQIARESGSVQRADRVVDAIATRFHLLASYPQLGRPREDLRLGLRSFPVEGHVILYRVEEKDVLVLHVFHSHRDITDLLRE